MLGRRYYCKRGYWWEVVNVEGKSAEVVSEWGNSKFVSKYTLPPEGTVVSWIDNKHLHSEKEQAANKEAVEKNSKHVIRAMELKQQEYLFFAMKPTAKLNEFLEVIGENRQRYDQMIKKAESIAGHKFPKYYKGRK